MRVWTAKLSNEHQHLEPGLNKDCATIRRSSDTEDQTGVACKHCRSSLSEFDCASQMSFDHPVQLQTATNCNHTFMISLTPALVHTFARIRC